MGSSRKGKLFRGGAALHHTVNAAEVTKSGTVRPFQHTQLTDTPLRKHVEELRIKFDGDYELILEELVEGNIIKFDTMNSSLFGQLRGTIIDTPQMSTVAHKLAGKSGVLEYYSAYKYIMYATSDRKRLIKPDRRGELKGGAHAHLSALLANRHQSVSSLQKLAFAGGSSSKAPLLYNPSFETEWMHAGGEVPHMRFGSRSEIAPSEIYQSPCVNYELLSTVSHPRSVLEILENPWLTPELALNAVHLCSMVPIKQGLPTLLSQYQQFHLTKLKSHSVRLRIIDSITDPILQMSALRELTVPGESPEQFFTDWNVRHRKWLNAAIPEEDFTSMPSRFTEPIFMELLESGSMIPSLNLKESAI